MPLVFPAPAGVIPSAGADAETDAGFPRTCGGDSGSFLVADAPPKFSPHLRG